MWSTSALGSLTVGRSLGALQGGQLGQYGIHVQAFVGRRSRQGHLAAAAEVELQPPKHSGCARQLNRNLPNLLIGTQSCGGGGGSFQTGVHGVVL